MLAKVEAEINKVDAEMKAASARQTTVGGTAQDELLRSLRKKRKDLQALKKRTRAQWMRALSIHLMSRCGGGYCNPGGAS